MQGTSGWSGDIPRAKWQVQVILLSWLLTRGNTSHEASCMFMPESVWLPVCVCAPPVTALMMSWQLSICSTSMPGRPVCSGARQYSQYITHQQYSEVVRSSHQAESPACCCTQDIDVYTSQHANHNVYALQTHCHLHCPLACETSA